MVCALCHQDKVLRKSHIYPEWLYKPLYDEKRRLEVLSIIPEGHNELKQKGMREYLLCDDCEQKISAWEGYARSVFVSPEKPLEVSREGALLSIRGLNYAKLKLFELSILWRAGISRLPFFEKVQLGPAHEERLRQLLLACDPSDPDRYGAVMFGLKVGKLPETLQVIAEPRPIRNYGIRAYNLTFGGFLWVFHVSSSVPPPLLRQCFLREDGSRLISVRNALEMRNLEAFAQELNRLGRAP
ncbi:MULTISPECIES: hypothetical protein [Paraburkholderia]|uniref:HNH endonuclease n=1 Tax=Paraburkholderia podalyriae TaxID=1938811 RepID=A0ABR7Q1W6_9BURK|nr:hypothetical protein [Paraburkholderia podalyriae]MBC8752545.1 hypothetical protein [Paraburkholderia podalyriae]